MIEMAKLIEESRVQFGTSGVRGRVVDMTDPVCWAYVRAFLQVVEPEARQVVLGHDLRPSSPRIAAACAAAIEQAGAQVVFAGAVPTPALAWYALQKRMPAVMVTGSHIPFDRNGIKFYRAHGEITKSHETAIVAARLAAPSCYSVSPGLPSPTVMGAYLERYRSFFPAGFLKGKRIAVYEHSSVARDMLGELLGEFGAEVIPLGRTDDFVPVDTEAVSAEDQVMATTWARAIGFDAIVSTDGDADRPLMGDEQGQWLRGDVVGLLCARYLGARVVVTPVSCNTAIETSGTFARVIRTRIGSPYVIAGIEAALAEGERGVVGFEANGGFLTGDMISLQGKGLGALPTRDAVLPVLCLLAASTGRGVPLSRLAEDLPRRFTASDRIKDFSSEKSRALIAEFVATPSQVDKRFGALCGALVNTDQTDGLRMTFATGEILHIRPSGNAPELRCYAEADSTGRAQELVARALLACTSPRVRIVVASL